MGLGIAKKIIALYGKYIELRFQLYKVFFGFEHANMILLQTDKRTITRLLRKNGAVIGENCDIETPLFIHNCSNYKNLFIGNNCHIGKDVFLDLKDSIEIYDNVTIAMRAIILTHFDTGKGSLKYKGFSTNMDKTVLEKGCFIGANATIFSGVRIGECSVVGAGAVVTESVPSYSLVAGVPAKIIRPIE